MGAEEEAAFPHVFPLQRLFLQRSGGVRRRRRRQRQAVRSARHRGGGGGAPSQLARLLLSQSLRVGVVATAQLVRQSLGATGGQLRL